VAAAVVHLPSADPLRPATTPEEDHHDQDHGADGQDPDQRNDPHVESSAPGAGAGARATRHRRLACAGAALDA
jgi:hypothetical protein